MASTPTKNRELSNFIPKEITTPNKDSPGISKTVYTHIMTLHRLIGDWSSIKEKGTRICKSILALKLYECDNDYYPHQTKSLIDSLLEALDGMENVVEGVNIMNHQMQALATLQNTNEPIINTWSVTEIGDNISKIFKALEKEFELKRVVTENIAHCRDEDLMEVYVSAWEFDTYFCMEISAYLFAEVGLSGVT